MARSVALLAACQPVGLSAVPRLSLWPVAASARGLGVASAWPMRGRSRGMAWRVATGTARRGGAIEEVARVLFGVSGAGVLSGAATGGPHTTRQNLSAAMSV